MASKRKASAASPTTIDLRPSKKQKTPDRNNATEQTNAIASRFVDQLRKASDKSGRQIATAFLELPDPHELPDYYQVIRLPISVDTIDAKVRAGQYADLTQLESDVKRMVQNAKDYNEPSSDIYSDAERIRKNTHNFMKIHNPAYKNPDYKAFSTPIPEGASSGPTTLRLNAAAKATSRGASRPVPGPGATPTPAPTTPLPASAEDEDDNADTMDLDQAGPTSASAPANGDNPYHNASFQDAQRLLVQEMLDHTNESGELDFLGIFGNLPSRKFEDYYETIKNPQSLKKILKSVNGWRSRHETSGNTEFKTWDALENEVAVIWENAKVYNEDGSDVYRAALELEKDFKERLAAVKELVREPSTSIKLKTGADKHGAVQGQPKSGLKLNLATSQKQSPAPNGVRSTASPALGSAGIAVDHAALQRQQSDVKSGVSAAAAVNGTQAASNAPGILPSTAHSGSVNNGLTTAINGVSPGVRPGSSSQSPYPAQGLAGAPNGMQYATNPLDNKWRPEGREVLIRKLALLTPDVNGTSAFKHTVPSHSKLAQYSVTVNLPSSVNALQIRPELSPELQGTTGRPYKVFVLCNGVRKPPKLEAYGIANGIGGTKSPSPTYEVMLQPGMNRIEVECAAAGAPKAGNLRGELELERLCVFANVLKG